MKKDNRIKPTLERIEGKLNDIAESLTPDIIWQASQYRDVKNLLNYVNLEIDELGIKYDEVGNPVVTILFKRPRAEIKFDNGEELPNGFVEALCRLNLISMEDQMSINDKCEKATQGEDMTIQKGEYYN